MLDYLMALGIAAIVVKAIKSAKPGEAVPVPEIKGIRVGKKSYTLRNAEAVPED